MVNSKNLGFHLHRIAWLAATVELEHQRVRPMDPWAKDYLYEDERPANDAESRAACLALLHVYSWMIKILQRRIDWTTGEALALGASYGDVADACGISRQAARQRWLKLRQRRDITTARPVRGLEAIGTDGTWANGLRNKRIWVRLAGGPRDGESIIVVYGETLELPYVSPSGSAEATPHVLRYIPQDDDLTVYVFDDKVIND
jgi:hypothetical protein